jgi:hypothetical protein
VAVLFAGARRTLSFGAGIPTLLGKRERAACPFLKKDSERDTRAP